MSLRVEIQAKVVISNDNVPNPQDLVFRNPGNPVIDSATYALGDSKVVQLPASASNQQMSLDGMTSAAILHLLTAATHILVTLVPTGGSLGACSAIKMLPGVPMIIGSDIAEIYFSNTDTLNAAQVHVGVAGN